MAVPLTITWAPTLRCNLMCTYCAARCLPVVTRGKEQPPEAWAECFAACPREVEMITCSVREASLYRGLPEVLEGVPWPIRLETNLHRDPREWLTMALWSRVKSALITCHFMPGNEEFPVWWERARWMREAMPDADLTVGYMPLWRDPPGMVEQVQTLAAEAGLSVEIQTFDDRFLWRDKRPQYGPAPRCQRGNDLVVLLPDGTAYRCLGHAYYDAHPLGNILADGWGLLLEGSPPCEDAPCSCDRGITMPWERASADGE